MHSVKPASVAQMFVSPIALAVVLNLAAVTVSSALPPEHSTATCACRCDAGPASQDRSYPGMASCSVYEGKTCNVEDTGGNIRSGTLRNCGASHGWTTGAAAGKATRAGVLATPPATTKPKAGMSIAPSAAAEVKR